MFFRGKRKQEFRDDRTVTEKFVASLGDVLRNSVTAIWSLTCEINTIDEQVEKLLAKRQELIKERLSLTDVANAQRKALGWEEVNLDTIETSDDIWSND